MGAVVLGLYLRRVLPEHYLGADTRDGSFIDVRVCLVSRRVPFATGIPCPLGHPRDLVFHRLFAKHPRLSAQDSRQAMKRSTVATMCVPPFPEIARRNRRSHYPVMSNEISPFADFLDQRREDITAEWLRRVRRDRKIPSADDLPKEELLDHLPYILDTIINRLRDTAVDRAGGQSHGEIRWKQHYRLDEVLREISILRKVLIEALFTFYCDTEGKLALEIQASDVLHACLDLTISDSTTGFVARQYEEIQAANRSLQELNLRVLNINDQLVEKDRQRLQMLRMITHEIANHLNALGMRVFALDLEKDQESIDSPAKSLSKSIAAMTALMKQLLEFATLDAERPRLERCEADSLFQELAASGREFAKQKGLSFVGNLDPTLEEIVTDRHLLHRVCLNLLTNAVKYTATGEVKFTFSARPEGNWSLEVSDTGCGIAREEREQIFNEFYRAPTCRETEPGVGLGLAITRHLVRLLDGRIELDSQLGTGSTFRVVLPRNGPAERMSEA
jgi:signal transduction histidine kinase